MEVYLREATPNDSEFMFELHRVSLGDAVVVTWGQWDAAQQREFHNAWFDPRRLLVITCKGRDAGVLDVDQARTEMASDGRSDAANVHTSADPEIVTLTGTARPQRSDKVARGTVVNPS